MVKFFSCVVKGLNVSILCGGLIVLAGCSDGKQAPQAPAGIQTYDFESDAELNQAVENFSLSCRGPCPESVGALLIKKRTQLFTCSFSLVGPNIILTNRHCIPDDIAIEGASCRNSIRAMFATNNGVSESFECDKVLSIPPSWNTDAASRTDFAFLQLRKEINRPVLKIDTEGVKDKEVLIAYVATPDLKASSPASILMQKTCTAHMNSFVLSNYTTPLAPVIAFKDCNIVGGNSGSAMIGAHGAIKAIAQASIEARDLGSPKQDLATKILRAMSRSGGFATGTNTACIANSQLKISPEKSGCISNPDEYGSNVQTQITEEVLQQELQVAQSLADASTDIFKFQPVSKEITPEMAQAFGDIANFDFIPGCIRGSKKDIPWAIRFENSGLAGIFNKYPEEILTTFQKPLLRLFMDIDDEVRLVIKSQILTQQVEVKLPLREITKNFSEVYELESSTLHTLNFSELRVPHVYKLGLCEK